MLDQIGDTFSSLGIESVSFIDEDGEEDFSIDTKGKVIKFPENGKKDERK